MCPKKLNVMRKVPFFGRVNEATAQWWSESCLVVWVKAESSWEAHVVSDPSLTTRSLVKT